jgi:hypothetical protein
VWLVINIPHFAGEALEYPNVYLPFRVTVDRESKQRDRRRYSHDVELIGFHRRSS